ncbi:hypothetical protein JKP88DRAFT_256494 [Tribonema minus]|uniref:Niemann-Pick C1 N-terminal domain-containing protein n=1 Tax=Tribonema minus TaxID=303371 RepID=A0A835YTW9_9STRA|nr:hypothetical protein JKP88DRAFT_256494 [Tribonema minus]
MDPRQHDQNQCTFTQDCFQNGVDTACTPREYTDRESSAPFPMNAAHGFNVAHDTIWDGSMADASSGLCARGRPDVQGRCIQSWDASLAAVAPIMCPQYAGAGCCTWQQNYALFQNLRTLVDSFGGATGCLACAANLVNLWCALVCSPQQGSYVTLHDPPRALMDDDLTGAAQLPVLQADVVLDADYACAVFESCSATAIAGASTAMQSAVGLLQFQLQTGAIGHGEYFYLAFDGRAAPNATRSHDVRCPHQLVQREDAEQSTQALPAPEPQYSGFKTDVLQCDSYWYPGSDSPPFPYPPPQQTLTSCSCGYCKAACSGGGGGAAFVPADNPIPIMNGFNYGLVAGVYAAVAALSAAVLLARRRSSRA